MSDDARPRGILLVVDDEPDIRKTVAYIVESLFPDQPVLTASDAESAQKAFSDGTVYAVLTDLRMPGASGIDLIQRVRTQRPDVRCALMTGFVEEIVDGVKLADLELVAVLRKPFPLAECKRVLSELMGAQ